jgi:hypothetical protein
MHERTTTANADKRVTAEWHLARAQKLEKSSGSGCAFSLMSAGFFPYGRHCKSKKNRLQLCRVVDVLLHAVSGICLREN